MEMLQHSVVTLVALVASAVVLHRVFRFANPGVGQSVCSRCPSAQGACGVATRGTTIHHPAVLIRTPAHVRDQTWRPPQRAGSVERPDPS